MPSRFMHIWKTQRLADLTRLGQVGTGTSGTVWLVYSSVGLQITQCCSCLNGMGYFFRGATQANRSTICPEEDAKVKREQQGAFFNGRHVMSSDLSPDSRDLCIAVVEMLSFWGATCCTAWNWDLVWERSSIPHAHGQHPTQILPCECPPCIVSVVFRFYAYVLFGS